LATTKDFVLSLVVIILFAVITYAVPVYGWNLWAPGIWLEEAMGEYIFLGILVVGQLIFGFLGSASWAVLLQLFDKHGAKPKIIGTVIIISFFGSLAWIIPEYLRVLSEIYYDELEGLIVAAACGAGLFILGVYILILLAVLIGSLAMSHQKAAE